MGVPNVLRKFYIVSSFIKRKEYTETIRDIVGSIGTLSMSEPKRLGEILPAVMREIEKRIAPTNATSVSAMIFVQNFGKNYNKKPAKKLVKKT